MPPGTEVDLGPGHIVLDGAQLLALPPPERGTAQGHSSSQSTHPNEDKSSAVAEMGGHLATRGTGRKDEGHFGRCLLWPNGCPSQLLLSSCPHRDECFGFH